MAKTKKLDRAQDFIQKRKQGMTLQEIAKVEGVSTSTVFNGIRSTWTAKDIEEWEEIKAGRLRGMISQQLDIQARPEIAEKIALRFGGNQIKVLQDTIERAESKITPDTMTQINININNYNQELSKLEEELNKLTGGRFESIIEGQITESDLQEHLNDGPRRLQAGPSDSNSNVESREVERQESKEV